MDAKLLAIFLGIINYSYCAGLLRTPKVYNAVITTDENLTPSRAFPVIQPTIHEAAITSTFPFAPFGPYRFYNAPIVHLNQPLSELREEQVPIPAPELSNKQLPKAEPLPPTPQPIPPEMQLAENLPPPPPLPSRQDPLTMPIEEKLPIPLNEFGLPPSLIPLHAYGRPPRPINLQPYPYNHYPLIYDSYNHFPDHYLPHYGYYPPHAFGAGSTKPSGKQQTSPSKIDPKPSASNEESKNPSNSDSNNFDSIKNGTENKNSEVPDVPPPPLPTATKTTK